jgi:hypothetical protein
MNRAHILFDEMRLDHSGSPLALSGWQRLDDLTGAQSTAHEIDLQETCAAVERETTPQRAWQLQKRGLGLCQECGQRARRTIRGDVPRLGVHCEPCAERFNAARRDARNFPTQDPKTPTV